MKKSRRVILLFILIAAVFISDAHALTPPARYPVQRDLGDGLVFHMTPQWSLEQGYPKSGLYRDGELIYTVDENRFWHNWPNAMFFSDDAMSFLVVPWFMDTIRFYEQGVFIHQIYVQYLLRDAQRIRWEHGRRIREREPVFPLHWDPGPSWRIGGDYHDRANNRLQVITVEGYKITFDLSTGFILSQYISPEHAPPEQAPEEQQSGQLYTMIALIGVSLLILGIIVALIKELSHVVIRKQ